MTRKYHDRSMAAGDTPDVVLEQEYFFPKANPPVTIKARSLEEAEAKLSDIK